MTIKRTQAFDAAWSAARADDSAQGSRVSYAELENALKTLENTHGDVDRFDAQHLAATIDSDNVLTHPAGVAAREFLATVGAGHGFDAATREACQADFSLRADKLGFKLAVPGRVLKDLHALPASVQQAAASTTDAQGTWDSVEVKSMQLAGQDVLVVHKDTLNGDGDVDDVQLFTPEGKRFAHGACEDAMLGFSWLDK